MWFRLGMITFNRSLEFIPAINHFELLRARCSFIGPVARVALWVGPRFTWAASLRLTERSDDPLDLCCQPNVVDEIVSLGKVTITVGVVASGLEVRQCCGTSGAAGRCHAAQAGPVVEWLRGDGASVRE
jgi:hypothetical protein